MAIYILLFLILLTVAFAGASFAPWVPTRKTDLTRIFRLANLKPGETFYDLGCGNGRVIIYAAKNFPAKPIGLEISFPFYLICKWRQLFHKKADFRYKSLYYENLSEADVIYFFGMPKSIERKLKPKLEKEAKRGARIISYVFPIEGWTAEKIDKNSENELPIHLYIR